MTSLVVVDTVVSVQSMISSVSPGVSDVIVFVVVVISMKSVVTPGC